MLTESILNSGLPANDDDESIEEVKHQDEDNLPNSLGSKRKKENLFKNAKSMSEKHLPETQLDEYVLKCKSVFKCRLCPRIVCLNEDTLKTHLNSKVRSMQQCLFFFYGRSSLINLMVSSLIWSYSKEHQFCNFDVENMLVDIKAYLSLLKDCCTGDN